MDQVVAIIHNGFAIKEYDEGFIAMCMDIGDESLNQFTKWAGGWGIRDGSVFLWWMVS